MFLDEIVISSKEIPFQIIERLDIFASTCNSIMRQFRLCQLNPPHQFTADIVGPTFTPRLEMEYNSLSDLQEGKDFSIDNRYY